MDTWLNAFLALLAILNPIGNMPVFADLTDHLDSGTRRRLFNLAVITGFVTLLLLTLTGRWIMQYVFQINIAEFRIAGGILLTVISTRRIAGSGNGVHEEQNHSVLELGIVPMAVPLLVGPGSIVTAILILDRDGLLVAVSAVTAVFALTWVILQASPFLSRLLGRFGRLVLSRILWIFIAAIGVHFLVSGIREAFGL